jgi:uncharacterized protein YprB with RNaseH-like and TPR domain
MSSLSDRLKSLGVNIGAEGINNTARAARRSQNQSLEQVLGGRPHATPQGETFLVEASYPEKTPHGNRELCLRAPMEVLGKWAGETRLADLGPEAFAFIDTETTGLSGGAGTYAYLIGAGRFEEGRFHLAQFFMRDPSEEPAQLCALEEFLAPCQAIVSFNGKTFDLPLLKTRYLVQGWQTPFEEMAHVDLLHLARRLWRDRLTSRTLLNLEAHILGALRSEEDVPGWMAPQIYFDYLRLGDPTLLRGILYHNAMDVISLATLLDHMAGMLAQPLERGAEHSLDLLALARLFEDLGDLARAQELYIHGLDHADRRREDLPEDLLLKALTRLSGIYKRQEDYEQAISIWIQAASKRDLAAHIELAKYFEHQARDYDQAAGWTQAAIALVNNSEHLLAFERRQQLDELEHRLARLSRKQDQKNVED